MLLCIYISKWILGPALVVTILSFGNDFDAVSILLLVVVLPWLAILHHTLIFQILLLFQIFVAMYFVPDSYFLLFVQFLAFNDKSPRLSHFYIHWVAVQWIQRVFAIFVFLLIFHVTNCQWQLFYFFQMSLFYTRSKSLALFFIFYYFLWKASCLLWSYDYSNDKFLKNLINYFFAFIFTSIVGLINVIMAQLCWNLLLFAYVVFQREFWFFLFSSSITIFFVIFFYALGSG